MARGLEAASPVEPSSGLPVDLAGSGAAVIGLADPFLVQDGSAPSDSAQGMLAGPLVESENPVTAVHTTGDQPTIPIAQQENVVLASILHVPEPHLCPERQLNPWGEV